MKPSPKIAFVFISCVVFHEPEKILNSYINPNILFPINLKNDAHPVLFINPGSMAGLARSKISKNLWIVNPFYMAGSNINTGYKLNNKSFSKQVENYVKIFTAKFRPEELIFISFSNQFNCKFNIIKKEKYFLIIGDTTFPLFNSFTKELDGLFVTNYNQTEKLKTKFPNLKVFNYRMFLEEKNLEVIRKLARGKANKSKTKAIVYLGNLNFDRLDINLIEKNALELEDYTFHFYGNFHEDFDKFLFESKLSHLKNISYRGTFSFKDIPEILINYSYGYIPYLKSKFNLGCYPTKINDYLANGLQILSTDVGFEPNLKKLLNIIGSNEPIHKAILKSSKKDPLVFYTASLNYLKELAPKYFIKEFFKIVESID